MEVHFLPLTFTPCTYMFVALFFGALTVSLRPLSMRTVTFLKSGEPIAYSPLPITSG